MLAIIVQPLAGAVYDRIGIHRTLPAFLGLTVVALAASISLVLLGVFADFGYFDEGFVVLATVVVMIAIVACLPSGASCYPER